MTALGAGNAMFPALFVVGMVIAIVNAAAIRGIHQTTRSRKKQMENTATLHPTHPTLQFKAKQAIRLSSSEAAALEGWLDDEE